MDQQITHNNDTSRQRLRALVAGLDDEALRQTIGDGWTVSALLAHVAFWDRSCAVRWDDFVRDGTLVAISGDVIDVVNAANRPAWLVLPGRTAVELAFAAADEADARIAALSADAVDRALEQRRRYMLDRSRHRTEHLDQIARSLGQ